jgi:hypothetical protein
LFCTPLLTKFTKICWKPALRNYPWILIPMWPLSQIPLFTHVIRIARRVKQFNPLLSNLKIKAPANGCCRADVNRDSGTYYNIQIFSQNCKCTLKFAQWETELLKQLKRYSARTLFPHIMQKEWNKSRQKAKRPRFWTIYFG